METNLPQTKKGSTAQKRTPHTHLLALLFILFTSLSTGVKAQCPTANTSQSPGGGGVSVGTGASVTISTCSKEGQYSRVTGITSGYRYFVSISNATSKITVRSASSTGTIVASGSGSLTFTASSASDHYIHWNSSSCGTSSTCYTTSITAFPKINSFNPTSGCAGTNTVTISGANFTSATGVYFNGTAASYTIASSTSIVALIPGGASSGAISITNAAGTEISTSSFSVNPPTACYCVPVYSTGCSLGDQITNLTLNSLSNNSGTSCSSSAPLGYIQYGTSPATNTTTLYQTLSYNASVTIGSGGNAGVALWIDYNDNGVFETTENYNSGASLIPASSTQTISITVPSTAAAGVHRLRARLVWNTAGNVIDPCASYSYGEVEDYSITIATLPVCNGSPTAGTVTSVTSGTSCPVDATLTLSGQSIASGLSYQWQTLQSNSSWAAIAGATGTSYRGNFTNTTQIRCLVTCNNSGVSAATNASTITVASPITFSTASVTPNGGCTPVNAQLNATAASSNPYVNYKTNYAATSGVATSVYAATGTTTVYDDNISSAITLPFNFTFYGQATNTIYISTNGYIVLGSAAPTSSIFTPVAIPNTTTPNNMIAGIWDDLNVYGTSSSISYFTTGTSPNRIFVIDFSNLKFYNAALNNGNTSFQIRLFETSNKVEVHVSEANDPTPSPKVSGIENAAGTAGLAAAGRNNTNWSVSSSTPEAWVFSPSNLTYSWSPSTYLSASNVANPGITAAQSSITYSVTATDLDGCNNTSTVALNVTQTPSLAAVSSQTVCQGTAITPVNFTLNPTGTVNWTNNNTATGLPASGTGNMTALSVASSTVAQTSIITVTPQSGSCTGSLVSFSVTVKPGPSFTSPQTLTYNSDPGQCGAFVHLAASATGTGNVQISYNVTNDTIFHIDTTVVKAAATDVCGSTNYTYNVIVKDNELPKVVGEDTIVISNDPGHCYASSTKLLPIRVSDNCMPPALSANIPATFPTGTNILPWTVTDLAGNSIHVNQVVYVKDTETPSIGGLNTVTVTLPAGTCTVTNVNLGSPVVSDNCGVASITNNAPAYYPVGTTTVTWTAVDVNGNSSTLNQLVQVSGSGGNYSLATPTVVSGPTTICSTALSNITYSTPAIPGATGYTWLVTSPITILSGQGTNSITVSFGTSLTTSHISVGAYNACGSGLTKTIAVSKSTPPAVPSAITGPTALCGLTTASYSVPAVTNATSYIWTLPSGSVILSGSGSNAITTSITASLTTGSISVQASNMCGSSAARSLSVSKIPSATGVISGPTYLCGQTSAIYSVAPVAGVSNYNWALPSGLNFVNGQNTNIITVSIASGFVSGNMTVTTSNTCGNSAAKTLSVTKSPSVPASIQGPLSLCGIAGTSQNVTYSVSAVSNATGYTWTLPVNAQIISGQGTNTLTAHFTSQFISGNISVVAVGNCANSGARSLTVSNVAPATPASIAGVSNLCGLSTSTFSVSASSVASSYNWSLPAGLSITSGQGTNAIHIAVGTFSAGAVSVTALNACGSSAARTLTVTPCNARLLSNDQANEVSNNQIGFLAYPNPSSGKVTFELTGVSSEDMVCELFDSNGKIVYTKTIHMKEQDKPVLDLEMLEEGMYWLRVILPEEKDIPHQMIVIDK